MAQSSDGPTELPWSPPPELEMVQIPPIEPLDSVEPIGNADAALTPTKEAGSPTSPSDPKQREDAELLASLRRQKEHKKDVRIALRDEPTEPAKVYFDGEDGRFWYPGQTVTGQIRCNPDFLQPDTKPIVFLEGAIRVKRTGEIGLGAPDSTLKFYRKDVANKGKLERHHHHENTFLFKIRIPERPARELKTPPTCFFTGENYWEVEVLHTLKISFPDSDTEVLTVPIQVRTTFTSEEEASFEVHEEEQEGTVMTFCCFPRGAMTAKLSVDKSYYLVGSSVRMILDVWNHSNRDIKGFRFALEAQFDAAHGTDRRNDILSLSQVELESQKVLKATDDGPTHQRIEVSLRLPRKTPPTTDFGEKMDIRHVAVVETLYDSTVEIQVEYQVAGGLANLRHVALADESVQGDDYETTADSTTHAGMNERRNSPFGGEHDEEGENHDEDGVNHDELV